MRKLMTLICCEICFREDRREVPVGEDGLSEEIDGIQLDLCAEHANRIPIRMIRATLETYGVSAAHVAKKKAQAKKSAPVKASQRKPIKPSLRCDFPGCTEGPHGTRYVAKNPQGLGAHKYSRHGVRGASVSAARQRDKKAEQPELELEDVTT